jgi:hypothetical protein
MKKIFLFGVLLLFLKMANVQSQILTLNNSYSITTLINIPAGTVFTQMPTFSADGSEQYQSAPDGAGIYYLITKQFGANYWFLGQKVATGYFIFARTAYNTSVTVPSNENWENNAAWATLNGTFSSGGNLTQLFFTPSSSSTQCPATVGYGFVPMLPVPPSKFPYSNPGYTAKRDIPISSTSISGLPKDAGTNWFTFSSFFYNSGSWTDYWAVIYRQNNIWRLSVIHGFPNARFFRPVYQCLTGGDDVNPPCNATWEETNGFTSYPSSNSLIDPIVGLLPSINTVSGVVFPTNFCQCNLSCNFQATNAVGGLYYWNDPANWSCGVVPSYSQPVIIPAGATVTLSGDVHAGSITNNGTIALAGYSILP